MNTLSAYKYIIYTPLLTYLFRRFGKKIKSILAKDFLVLINKLKTISKDFISIQKLNKTLENSLRVLSFFINSFFC